MLFTSLLGWPCHARPVRCAMHMPGLYGVQCITQVLQRMVVQHMVVRQVNLLRGSALPCFKHHTQD